MEHTENTVVNAAAANTAPVVATPEQQAALHAEIKANFNNLVDVAPTKFHFRKVKDAVSGLETKRPTVEIPLPVPSVEGIIDILSRGGKELELLQQAVADVIIEQAREYINANEQVTDLNFPYNTLSWAAIANLPKADRKGGGIAAEVWAEFAADYIAVMPTATGKPVANVELAAKVYLQKFATCKTDKRVLAMLRGQLAIYISATSNGEAYAECVQFLDKKAEDLIKTDSSSLLDNL